MAISLELLDGTSTDRGAILRCLTAELMPKAIRMMNTRTLPKEVQLLPEDKLPTNQRNLTDFRTRIGILLEYQLAQAVNATLPSSIKSAGLVLTYVVANQFPDLAFRSQDGTLGIRFEVKTIQVVAEEKSANFATLIKDIRKGTDFVAVMIWDWKEVPGRNAWFPRIEASFVMDAYDLAQMRDRYWLNNPPKGLQGTRQGFDLTFAVNAGGSSFNQEENNLGKLMRIFDKSHEHLLPKEIREGQTLQTYYRFTSEAARFGVLQVGQELGKAVLDTAGTYSLVSDQWPICFLAERNGKKLVIMCGQNIPTKNPSVAEMTKHDADHILRLNHKFDWSVYSRNWQRISSGKKPAEAAAWINEQW